MFKVKKAFALLMQAVTALGSIPAYAADYVSIADIREETKDDWHETYTYKGEEIRVDADIEIPDVDVMPIVRVKWGDNIVPLDEPHNAEIEQLDNNSGFNSWVKSGEGIYYRSKIPGASAHSIVSLAEDAQAENSPFTPDDAIEFLHEKLTPYRNIIGTNLQITGIFAKSRAYAFKKADRRRGYVWMH